MWTLTLASSILAIGCQAAYHLKESQLFTEDTRYEGFHSLTSYGYEGYLFGDGTWGMEIALNLDLGLGFEVPFLQVAHYSSLYEKRSPWYSVEPSIYLKGGGLNYIQLNLGDIQTRLALDVTGYKITLLDLFFRMNPVIFWSEYEFGVMMRQLIGTIRLYFEFKFNECAWGMGGIFTVGYPTSQCHWNTD